MIFKHLSKIATGNSILQPLPKSAKRKLCFESLDILLVESNCQRTKSKQRVFLTCHCLDNMTQCSI